MLPRYSFLLKLKSPSRQQRGSKLRRFLHYGMAVLAVFERLPVGRGGCHGHCCPVQMRPAAKSSAGLKFLRTLGQPSSPAYPPDTTSEARNRTTSWCARRDVLSAWGQIERSNAPSTRGPLSS